MRWLNHAFSLVKRWLRESISYVRVYSKPGVSLRARIIGPSRLVLGRGVRIHPFAVIDCRADPFLGKGRSGSGRVVVGDGTSIASGSMILPYGGEIRLGDNCTINPYTVLYGHGGLQIGAGTRIACHTVIIPANHVFADPERPIRSQGLTKKGIRIGRDVWIGANVTILDGARIADGCVVAAQSLVKGSFDSGQVLGGVPARVLKERQVCLEPSIPGGSWNVYGE